MCVYFVLEIFLFVIIITTFHSSAKVKMRWLFFFGLYWVLVAGLRGYNVGNDTSDYVAFFEGTNIAGVGYGTVDYPGDSIEIGFTVVGRILSWFSHNGTFFLLAHALFVWMAIVMFYKDKQYALWAFLLLFIVRPNFIVINVAIRQSFSIGFLLWGFYLLKDLDYTDKKQLLRNIRFVIGLGCVIFAITVHRTSIMLIPGALLLYFIKVEQRWIFFTAIIVSFIISLFFVEELGIFIDSVLYAIGALDEENVALLGDRYEDTFGKTTVSIFTSLSFALPCLLTTYLSNKQERSAYSFRCYVFFVCFYLFLNRSFMAERLGLLFCILGMPSFIPQKANKGNVWFLIYILITAFYLWRCYVGYENWTYRDSNLPYYFFWEK